MIMNPFHIRLTRTLSVLGTVVLLGAVLCVPAARGDQSLLRGPRKPIPARMEASAAAAGKQGVLEGIASAPVRFYQKFLGASWAWRCHYYPACSNYALLAIRKHGAIIGSVMTFDRLQHEANEARYSPLILTRGEIRVYDPLENNDYWWYKPPD